MTGATITARSRRGPFSPTDRMDHDRINVVGGQEERDLPLRDGGAPLVLRPLALLVGDQRSRSHPAPPQERPQPAIASGSESTTPSRNRPHRLSRQNSSPRI